MHYTRGAGPSLLHCNINNAAKKFKFRDILRLKDKPFLIRWKSKGGKVASASFEVGSNYFAFLRSSNPGKGRAPKSAVFTFFPPFFLFVVFVASTWALKIWFSRRPETKKDFFEWSRRMGSTSFGRKTLYQLTFGRPGHSFKRLGNKSYFDQMNNTTVDETLCRSNIFWPHGFRPKRMEQTNGKVMMSFFFFNVFST